MNLQKKELLDIVLLACEDAGKKIMKIYESGDFSVQKKSDKSPLTTADLASNETLFSYLNKTGIEICSEESILDVNKRTNYSKFWLIDPLDGTKDFMAKNGEFSICVALIENAKPQLAVIYIPWTREVFYSAGENQVFKNGELLHPTNYEKAVISGHSSHSVSVDKICEHFGLERKKCGSAIKFCRLIEGKASLYPRFCASSIWDIAAGDYLLAQSGGAMVNMRTNEPFSYAKELKNDFFIAVNASQMQNLQTYLKFAKSLLDD